MADARGARPTGPPTQPAPLLGPSRREGLVIAAAESSPRASDTAPHIVTLRLAEPVQERLTALRARYFPPRPYELPAHLTLFHAVPAARATALARTAARVAADCAPFAVALGAVRPLGRGGFAVAARAPEVAALRGALARGGAWTLSPQDRAPHRPHITLANKLPPEAARAGMAECASLFWAPTRAQAAAIDLFAYEGGPWRAVASFALGGP